MGMLGSKVHWFVLRRSLGPDGSCWSRPSSPATSTSYDLFRVYLSAIYLGIREIYSMFLLPGDGTGV